MEKKLDELMAEYQRLPRVRREMIVYTMFGRTTQHAHQNEEFGKWFTDRLANSIQEQLCLEFKKGKK